MNKIDPDKRIVSLEDRLLPFDYLVLALGSQANYYDILGLAENSFPLQSLADAQKIYDHITKLCARASSESMEEERKNLLRFVIGGGGLSGVEFAAELADYTARCTQNYNINCSDVEIIVIEVGDHVVPQMEKSFAERIQRKLLDKNVSIMTATKILSRSPDTVTISPGKVLKTKTLIWTGGIRISDLFQQSGIKSGPLGRILVDQFLRAEGYPCIYAIGDNALAINPATGKPVPAAAQFALQQGRLVSDNIYANITMGIKKPYQPRVWGEVVSLGKHLAVGWLALPLFRKLTFVGFLASLLKTAIEEKHLILLRKESRNWINY